MSEHYLSRLFLPKSVALIGATEREGALGRFVWLNMQAAKFRGPIYAVNPKHDTVFGEVCYARLNDLPAPPDLLVIATPAQTVANILRDAGEAGIRDALILSAGFAEIGAEGKVLAEAIEEIAKRYRIRLLGPNCVGMMRPAIGLNATFANTAGRPGSLALVSQSGAVCTAILDWAATTEIGFSSVISLGGALDVDFGEVLDFLVNDAETKSILLYVEGIQDARGFLSALRAAARIKPVVVLKAGRHAASSKAASSHTGALTGNDAVFDAALARSGALRVMTSLQLFAAARLLAEPTLAKSLRGSRLAIITNGGGPGVVAADCAADNGLVLASLSTATIKSLDASLPAHWSHGNPIDLIGDATSKRFGDAIQAVAADAGVDALLVLFCPQTVTTAEDAADAVIVAAQQAMVLHSKPVFTAMLGGTSVVAGRARLDAAHIPNFLTPENAVEAFSYLARFRAHQAFLLQSPAAMDSATESPSATLSLAECAAAVTRANAIRATVVAEQRTLLSETEAKQLLAAFGLPVATGEIAATREEAEAIAKRMGFPVVMKIHAPRLGQQVSHKSDIGGVRLNLATTRQVGHAFDEMMEAVTAHLAKYPAKKAPAKRVKSAPSPAPDAMLGTVTDAGVATGIEGVNIQPMLKFPFAREVLVGVSRDAAFGPVIAFGAGGVAVEAVRDTALALPPLNAVLATELISRTRVSRLLNSYRNVPGIDHAALLDVLVRVSTIVCQLPWIAEMDLNPVLAHPSGAAVVDARIVIDAITTTAPLAGIAHQPRYQHMAIFPYPIELEREITLKDKSTLKLRAIRPDDAEREQAFVAAMSDTSRYYRFLHPISALSDDMLARFTQLDYAREMALVALVALVALSPDTTTGTETANKTGSKTGAKTDADTSAKTVVETPREKIAGVARYHPNPDRETVEFAIAIADAWQGKGLGEQLMKALVSCARDAGYRQIEGSVLPGNRGMLKLAAVIGFTIEPAGDAVNTIKITLAL